MDDRQAKQRAGGRIGRYLVTGRIGRGSMGMVYRAFDEVLERDIAVKVLTAEAAESEEHRRRFAIEADVAAKLQHPNIVNVFELSEDRGVPYVAMELLSGADLDALMESGETLLLEEKLDIVIQVCRGLHYAHEHRIIHRDVRPSNIRVLEDGTAKVLGFGIAKLGATGVTRSGMIAATVHYMSPEQVRGQALDGRSDVFATGVILFQLLTGHRPFEGDTVTAILYKIVHEATPALEAYLGESQAAIIQVVNRALAKEPADRYPSAAALADDLSRILAAHLRTQTRGLPADSRESLMLARRLLKEGRGEESLARLREVSARHPDALEARRALRWATLELQRRGQVPAAASPEEGFPELEATFRPSATVAAPAEETSGPDRPFPPDDNVQFTIYRPRAMAPARWYPMLVFAHLSERRRDAPPEEPDPVEEVQRQATALLEDASAYRSHTDDSAQSVPFEANITFVPSGDGLEFNPSRRTFRWTESLHREEFRFRIRPGWEGDTARGRLTVYFGCIVLAEFRLTIRIEAGGPADLNPPPPEHARPFRKLFASYSHHDRPIVEEYREYARAVGDRYLLDVGDLRSGERWQPAIEGLIRQADVFQLFWSSHVLDSAFVRHEWEYAVGLRRTPFIRPVYWEDPLPCRGDLPPPELRELHFERIYPRALGHRVHPPEDEMALSEVEVAAPAAARPTRSAAREAPPLASSISRPVALVVRILTGSIVLTLLALFWFQPTFFWRDPLPATGRVAWDSAWGTDPLPPEASNVALSEGQAGPPSLAASHEGTACARSLVDLNDGVAHYPGGDRGLAFPGPLALCADLVLLSSCGALKEDAFLCAIGESQRVRRLPLKVRERQQFQPEGQEVLGQIEPAGDCGTDYSIDVTLERPRMVFAVRAWHHGGLPRRFGVQVEDADGRWRVVSEKVEEQAKSKLVEDSLSTSPPYRPASDDLDTSKPVTAQFPAVRTRRLRYTVRCDEHAALDPRSSGLVWLYELEVFARLSRIEAWQRHLFDK